MVGNTTYHQSIQVFAATNKVYNAPAICFDYAVNNYTSVKISGNDNSVAVPNFLAGTVEACYSIPTIDVNGYTMRTDVETASTSPTGNIAVYLVDTQSFMDKNEVFMTGFTLKDTPYTNVGDSTDTAAVGTIYGSG
jgi:GH25 family lysozyme M1 (1,4-beta-N-acetylmuramidase)